MAFFYILIKKIEESETLYLQHDLLRLLPKLGLRLPDHVSSFLRFVRRNTDKAFRKKKFSPLSHIPAPVLPKPSNDIVGPLCRDAGISLNWLFNSSDVYTGHVTVSLGMLLELNHIKTVKGVTDSQCASWVQRLFHLDSLPHSGTIQRQWGRIVSHASNVRGKKDERDAYLKYPYQPPSNSKLVPVSVSQPQIMGTQCENHFPTLVELSSIAFKRSSVVSEADIEKIYHKFQVGKTQLSDLQDKILSATSELDKLRKRVGHYNTKNVYKRDKRALATRATLDKCLKEVESLKAKVVSLEQKKNNALKLK